MFPTATYQPDSFVSDPNWNTPKTTGSLISSTARNLQDYHTGSINAPSNIQSVKFSYDGTKLFVVQLGLYCFRYTLGTPFTLSGGSFNTRTTLSGLTGLVPSKDGLNFYMTSVVGTGVVGRFTTSTPFDLDNAVFQNQFDTSNEISSPENLDISLDGRYLYVCDNSSYSSEATIALYYLETPFDVTTAVYLEKYVANASDSNIKYVSALKISPNGDYLWFSYWWYDTSISDTRHGLLRIKLNHRFRLYDVGGVTGVDNNTWLGSDQAFGFDYPPQGDRLVFGGNGSSVYSIDYTD